MVIDNLIDLIRATKPRKALFTTYTLSLSFVEAVLLPALRNVGCRDIAILVDANEAAASLSEAHARYAGRRYWIAPVVAPGGGIFHPKLAYLSGESSDVLAVGSGNLTLPGQSGQLETLDAVSSAAAPALFQQFAKMAQELAAEIEVTSKQAAELIGEYAQRAESIGSAAISLPQSFPEIPYLVHSIGRPPRDQIIELWKKLDINAETLTVLSPFHAPDGGPIVRLAEGLGAENLLVGLDGKTLVAPFDEKRFKRTGNVRYVTPDLNERVRPLHGKIIEVYGSDGTLVISGSINATKQSLESTKNIEVSIARLLPSRCFKWKDTEPARYEPNSYVAPIKGETFAYLDATLERDGRVYGQLSGLATFPASMTSQILLSDESIDSPVTTVTIGASGNFTFSLNHELTTDGALQLELTAPNLRAMCWLNIAEDLLSTDEERRERQAIRHILRGDFNSDDVTELLQILYRAAHLEVQERETRRNSLSTKPEAENDSADKSFSYFQWQMSGTKTRAHSLLGFRNGDALRAFIRWLNADIRIEIDRPDTTKTPGRHPPRKFSDLEHSEAQGEGVDIQSQLGKLVASIPHVLAQSPGTEYGTLLASVAGAYALKLTMTSSWPDKLALSPLLSWLDTYSRFKYGEAGFEFMEHLAIGATMVTAAYARKQHWPIPSSLLKESLLRFTSRHFDQHILKLMLAEALKDEIFNRVNPELRKLALDSCGEVWEAESLDESLYRIVLMSSDPKVSAIPEDEAMFPGVLSALRAQRRSNSKRRSDGVITTQVRLEAGGCPHCYKAFDEAGRKRLRAHHAMVCHDSFCGKVIFYLENPAVAQRIKGALTHA